MLPCCGILLRDLILEMLLPLLQHIQLSAQHQDSVLGRLLALLGGCAAEPGPHVGKMGVGLGCCVQGLMVCYLKKKNQAALVDPVVVYAGVPVSLERVT